jgi:hypothetical protein
MKYRKSDKGYQKRGSNTNLTVGAFGTPKIISQNLKVLRKSLRNEGNCNKNGVENG